MQKNQKKPVFCTIPLSQIDEDDLLYAFRYTPDDKIRDSIENVGVLNPPRVQGVRDHYRIVTGFRRIAALKKTNETRVDVFCYDSSVDPVDLLRIAIFDNLSERPLNPLEVSEIISKYRQNFHYSRKDIIDKVLPMLGYGKNPRIFSLLAPLKKLEARWKDLFLQERLALEMASHFAEVEEQDRAAFFSMVEKLMLGKNRQKEFWHLLRDIAANENLPVARILGEKPVRDLIEDDKMTAPQRAEKLKNLFWQQRYPIYTKVKQRFNKIIRDSHFPPGIVLQAPPYFEGETFHLSFDFCSEREFKKQLDFLVDLYNKGSIKAMVDVTDPEELF